MTREECIATRNDVEMIRHPEWWTLRVVLPLKRYVGREVEHGFLANLTAWPTGYRVYIGLIYLPPDNRVDYASAEAVVADGWMVD